MVEMAETVERAEVGFGGLADLPGGDGGVRCGSRDGQTGAAR